MSFYQKSVSYECYKIIENFNRHGYWYCICHLYNGCQTKESYVSNIRRYCPICQFEDTFSINELNQIKKNLNKMQTYYYDILGHICEIKIIDGTDDFWEK